MRRVDLGPGRVHLGLRRAGNEGRPGFTVPLSSLRTRDGVEGLGENKGVDDTEEKN
jgi:hypothetical protein